MHHLDNRRWEEAYHSCFDYGSMFLHVFVLIVRKVRVPEEILVRVQSKTWMDEELMKDYVWTCMAAVHEEDSHAYLTAIH